MNTLHRIPALAMIALEPSQINSCCTVVALESFNRGGPMATENLGVAHKPKLLTGFQEFNYAVVVYRFENYVSTGVKESHIDIILVS